MVKQEDPDELLTAKEVAAMLKVDLHTLYKWRKAQENLPFYSLGTNPERPVIRYRKSDVLAFLGIGRIEKK
jgi:hypothetical protein